MFYKRLLLQVKAAIRTVNPKEEKYMQPDPKFKIAVSMSARQLIWVLMMYMYIMKATACYANSLHRPIFMINQQYTKYEIHSINIDLDITVRVLILAQPNFSRNGWKWGISNNKRNYELAHLLDSLLQFIVVTHISVFMNKRTWCSTNSAKIWIPLK